MMVREMAQNQRRRATLGGGTSSSATTAGADTPVGVTVVGEETEDLAGSGTEGKWASVGRVRASRNSSRVGKIRHGARTESSRVQEGGEAWPVRNSSSETSVGGLSGDGRLAEATRSNSSRTRLTTEMPSVI